MILSTGIDNYIEEISRALHRRAAIARVKRAFSGDAKYHQRFKYNKDTKEGQRERRIKGSRLWKMAGSIGTATKIISDQANKTLQNFTITGIKSPNKLEHLSNAWNNMDDQASLMRRILNHKKKNHSLEEYKRLTDEQNRLKDEHSRLTDKDSKDANENRQKEITRIFNSYDRDSNNRKRMKDEYGITVGKD
jgi:hypothetical protein